MVSVAINPAVRLRAGALARCALECAAQTTVMTMRRPRARGQVRECAHAHMSAWHQARLGLGGIRGRHFVDVFRIFRRRFQDPS